MIDYTIIAVVLVPGVSGFVLFFIFGGKRHLYRYATLGKKKKIQLSDPCVYPLTYKMIGPRDSQIWNEWECALLTAHCTLAVLVDVKSRNVHYYTHMHLTCQNKPFIWVLFYFFLESAICLLFIYAFDLRKNNCFQMSGEWTSSLLFSFYEL